MNALTTPAAPPLRVALCLPSGLWRSLLASALATQADVTVGELQPTVVVTAVQDHRADWVALAQLCRARAPVPVLVMGEKLPPLAARALRLGAAGYIDRDATWDDLLGALRALHAGELWAEPAMALGLLRRALRSPLAAPPPLTARELEVMHALATGKRNKEIAVQLAISETTVKSHLNRAYRKLHLSDRLQAALYVERHGLDAAP